MSQTPQQPDNRPDDLEPDFPELVPESELEPLQPEPEPEPDYGEVERLTEAGLEPEPTFEGELAPEPQPAGAEYAVAGAAAGYGAARASGGRRVDAARNVKPRILREIGQLWGGVFFAAERQAPRIVVMTSAGRREGVTQVATALAMCGAATQTDGRVALIDANMRHPRVADLLKIDGTPGLSDVLAGRVGLDQAMQTLVLDERHELSVLTAGETEAQPLGLLRSRQFKTLLGTLRDRFDHVVIDAPATNLYADPQIVSSLADGVLVVVHSGRTRRESVAEAKKRLELAQARFLGLVLNQRTYPIPSFLYRRL